MLKLFNLLVLLALTQIVLAQNVTFRLFHIEGTHEEGVIRIAIYETESAYKKEVTKLLYSFSKEDLVLGTLLVKLDLEPGKYGVAFLDDTNKDAKMNFNLLGIPKEGYAFTRMKDYGYSKPSFKEIVVDIEPDKKNVFDVYFNYFL